MPRGPFLAAVMALAAATAAAQEPPPAPEPTPSPAEDLIKRDEVVVVSASKVESALVNAPATMSVVTQEALETTPAQNFGDLLRAIPGLNVIQTSARDINMTSRQNTSTLANTQLVLLDGRSIYLDFFGMVLWDFVPVNPSEIRQIEVIRGPASAVWGANAVTGVVNIITKTPRESAGTNVTLSAGTFSRDGGTTAGEASGMTYGANASITRVPNERWAYKISAGYFSSDDLPRPAGTVPVGRHPLNTDARVGGGQYPRFANEGTSQPKFDVRLDQEVGGGRVTYGAGVAGTEGIIHSGGGPFDISQGTLLGYGKVSYNRGSFKLAAFTNVLDGLAANLVSLDAAGNPVQLDFKTRTYDVEIGDSRILAGRHILTYGGNVRRSDFDISMAPHAEPRTEAGAYLQDEFFTNRFRLVGGVRLDHFSAIGRVLVSPRLSAVYKPGPDHSVRVTVNRAFRSPTVLDNALDVTPVIRLRLGTLDPRRGDEVFPLMVHAVGNPDLDAESLLSYELAYAATVAGRTQLGLALYLTDMRHNITGGPPEYYTAANPPPGWPLAPELLTVLAGRGVRLPARTAPINGGAVRNRGVEVSLDHTFSRAWRGQLSYSLQDDPRPLAGDPAFPAVRLSVPPRHRVNAGLNYSGERVMASVSANHASDAFWADVLPTSFSGTSSAYTMVNALAGLRWAGGRITTLVKGTNLANQDIQQHNFGDVLKRSLAGEVRFEF
jgi:iron complex outermembrane receptor protein